MSYARVRARTQSSLAVSGDGRRWTLLNASPDLRAQVQATPALASLLLPSGAARTWPHRDDVDGFFVAALRKRWGEGETG